MTRTMLLLGMSLTLAACARSTASQRADGEASAMAFKSSLAVLLEHRAELALTAEQVDRFEKLEFSLHEKNIGLQQQLDVLQAQRKKDSRPWHGGYMGGGTHDAHGGKGSSSGPPEAEQARLVRRERLERIDSTLRQMQDNDTLSYMEAERVLSDAQKPRARELFSQEREKLLKQLEALHYRLRKGDY
ncbi:MAG TPA: hypothetical protein VEU33_05125 [Archangium sp.]|nr:hypothetical protein [Archangium sp.]